jgi:hypothetical protein
MIQDGLVEGISFLSLEVRWCDRTRRGFLHGLPHLPPAPVEAVAEEGAELQREAAGRTSRHTTTHT